MLLFEAWSEKGIQDLEQSCLWLGGRRTGQEAAREFSRQPYTCLPTFLAAGL